MNLKELGIEQAKDEIFDLADKFEKLGYNADSATDAMIQFISSGNAGALKQLGVYLDNNTQEMLRGQSVTDRMA